MYMVGWDVNINLRAKIPTTPYENAAPPNCMISPYRTADGKAFWMLGLESERHWVNTCAALGHPEWIEDERFADIEGRVTNTVELTARFVATIAARTMDEWAATFDAHDVWWSPIQATHEAIDDPQVIASGALIEAPVSDGTLATMVASPVDFDGTPWSVRAMSPELGQHTETLLMELGKPWDEIEALKAAGIIP